MSQQKVKFTKEFKEEAVKLVTEQGYSQSEAAKNLGVNSKNLSRWISEVATRTKAANVTDKMPVEPDELQQLRKDVKRLKMERDILKKAAVFFANESG